jgi:hypothetical protein
MNKTMTMTMTMTDNDNKENKNDNDNDRNARRTDLDLFSAAAAGEMGRSTDGRLSGADLQALQRIARAARLSSHNIQTHFIHLVDEKVKQNQ